MSSQYLGDGRSNTVPDIGKWWCSSLIYIFIPMKSWNMECLIPWISFHIFFAFWTSSYSVVLIFDSFFFLSMSLLTCCQITLCTLLSASQPSTRSVYLLSLSSCASCLSCCHNLWRSWNYYLLHPSTSICWFNFYISSLMFIISGVSSGCGKVLSEELLYFLLFWDVVFASLWFR